MFCKNRTLKILSVFILTGCSVPDTKEEGPTYKPYASIYISPDESLQSLWTEWQEIKSPAAEFTKEFSAGWKMMVGSSEEGLSAPFRKLSDKERTIDLPHRILQPDSPIWYERQLTIEEPGFLSISADDGAQLFIEGKRVLRVHNQYFPVDTTGALTITIRVLNNAMEGGLNKVQWLTKQQFKNYEKERKNFARINLWMEKVLLQTKPDSLGNSLLQQLLQNVEEATMLKAGNHFDQNPMLFPYLSRVSDKHLKLHVLTDGNQPVILRWLSGERTEEIQKSGHVTIFDLEVQPGNVYQYQLRCRKTVSRVYTIDLSDQDSAWTFNVWADSQGGWDNFNRNLMNTADHHDAFGVGAGDLVANGSDSLQWVGLIKTLSAYAAERPYYLIPGNHDYDGYYDDLQPTWFHNFTTHEPPNYFAWTYKNAAFIALDPNENFPIGINEGTWQYTWFHEQLKKPAWKNAEWRFVLLHQPPYSQGWPGYEGDRVIRYLLEPQISLSGIDFIISGHTHDYERLQKQYGNQATTFLIVGGGGGSVEPSGISLQPVMDTVVKTHHMGRFAIRGRQVSFEAIDINSSVIDSFTYSK